MAHSIHCLNCGEYETDHEFNDCANWEPDPQEAEKALIDWVTKSPQQISLNREEIECLIGYCEDTPKVRETTRIIEEKITANAKFPGGHILD